MFPLQPKKPVDLKGCCKTEVMTWQIKIKKRAVYQDRNNLIIQRDLCGILAEKPQSDKFPVVSRESSAYLRFSQKLTLIQVVQFFFVWNLCHYKEESTKSLMPTKCNITKNCFYYDKHSSGTPSNKMSVYMVS